MNLSVGGLILFMADFSSGGYAFKAGVKEKGDKIPTPLQWKTHAEAKQQNLLSCKILHTVSALDRFIGPEMLSVIHSFISLGFKSRKLAGHCYVFHFSAFALHLSLHFLSGKQ